MDSILTSIKKLLGIEESYTHFDQDLVMYINSSLMHLSQIGIGAPEGFVILDKTDTWSDFIGTRKDLEAIKMYVYLKVRLMFDPPQTGYLVDAIKNLLTEIEWRINLQVDGGGV